MDNGQQEVSNKKEQNRKGVDKYPNFSCFEGLHFVFSWDKEPEQQAYGNGAVDGHVERAPKAIIEDVCWYGLVHHLWTSYAVNSGCETIDCSADKHDWEVGNHTQSTADDADDVEKFCDPLSSSGNDPGTDHTSNGESSNRC